MERTVKPLKIAIIGSGNVATQFARHLKDSVEIVQVYSRDESHAKELAQTVGINNATNKSEAVTKEADIYLVAVKDDALIQIATDFTGWPGLWLHTSGTTSIDVFKGYREAYGVIYPLQTITRSKEISMEEIPLYIEACDEETLTAISHLAQVMGAKEIKVCDSEHRMKLHIAAVFACNYVNFMLAKAQEVLQQSGERLSVLTPLIAEVTDKALSDINLETAQTGPARRNDVVTIERHLSALDGETKQIYKFMADTISKHYIDK